MDQKALSEFLDCDQETGKLYWKARLRCMFSSDRDMKKWNTKFAGKEAMTAIHNKGYRRGSLLGKSVYAHRVVYTMVYGPLGEGKMIDHINGDRLDNRACNLRAVTHLENCRNQTSRAISSTGVRGVHFVKRDGTFQARVRAGKKSKTRSGFKTIGEATIVRRLLEAMFWAE